MQWYEWEVPGWLRQAITCLYLHWRKEPPYLLPSTCKSHTKPSHSPNTQSSYWGSADLRLSCLPWSATLGTSGNSPSWCIYTEIEWECLSLFIIFSILPKKVIIKMLRRVLPSEALSLCSQQGSQDETFPSTLIHNHGTTIIRRNVFKYLRK